MAASLALVAACSASEPPCVGAEEPQLLQLWRQGDGGLPGLASPSSAVFDAGGQQLYVGNADGSGLSVFLVDGDHLVLGPTFPAPATRALARVDRRLVSGGPDGLVSWDLSAAPSEVPPTAIRGGAVTALWAGAEDVYAAGSQGLERVDPETLAARARVDAAADARYLDGVARDDGVRLVAAAGDELVRVVFAADGAVRATTRLAALDGVALSPDGTTIAATTGCGGQNVLLYGGPDADAFGASGDALRELPSGVAVWDDAVAPCPTATDHPQWGDTVDWEEHAWDTYPERAFPSALRFVDDDTLVVATRHGAAAVVLRREAGTWTRGALYDSAPPSLLYEIGPRDYFGPFRPYAELRGQAAIAQLGTRVAVTSDLLDTARLIDLDAGQLDLAQRGQGGVDGLAGAYTLARDDAYLYVAGRLDDSLGVFALTDGGVEAVPAANLPPCDAAGDCVARHQMLRVALSHDHHTVFANDFGPPGVHAFQAGGATKRLASVTIPPCVDGGETPKPVLTDVTVAPNDRDVYVSDFQREGSVSCVWQLRWDGSTLERVARHDDAAFGGVETLLIPRDGASLITTSYVAGGLAVAPLDPNTGAIGAPSLYARPEYYGVEFMVMTSDQRTLFVTNPVQGLLLTVVRDPATGALTLRHVVAEEAGEAFLDVAGVALSPDERLLAVTNRVRGSVSFYQRDAAGDPVFATRAVSPNLAFANGVTFSPNGQSVLVAAAHAFTLSSWSVPCKLLEAAE